MNFPKIMFVLLFSFKCFRPCVRHYQKTCAVRVVDMIPLVTTSYFIENWVFKIAHSDVTWPIFFTVVEESCIFFPVGNPNTKNNTLDFSPESVLGIDISISRVIAPFGGRKPHEDSLDRVNFNTNLQFLRSMITFLPFHNLLTYMDSMRRGFGDVAHDLKSRPLFW